MITCVDINTSWIYWTACIEPDSWSDAELLTALATFAGAGGGAIITVLGLWWLETRKHKLENDAIALRMAPHLIDLRGNLRQCALVWNAEDRNEVVSLDHIKAHTDKAFDSWRKVLPMLDHFPDSAVNCYRLEGAFKAITDQQGNVADRTTVEAALKYASSLANRFKVDKVDLR